MARDIWRCIDCDDIQTSAMRAFPGALELALTGAAGMALLGLHKKNSTHEADEAKGSNENSAQDQRTKGKLAQT
ncbi:MAG TPA: hypothetical protein VFW23_10240 [Tepidisphaeraceae bacterium]|nr:hypothetical protein [Tepidisphaeraceae bacterium]